MTAPTYTPRAGTMPAQCIAFFQDNPEEELNLEDIAEKFDGNRNAIHTNLALARDAGFVARYQNADGEYLYKAGPKISHVSGVNIDAAHTRSPPAAPTAAAAPLNPWGAPPCA